VQPQPSHPGPSPDRILQLGFGFTLSKTLLTAVGMGLFTELAKAPLTADRIASKFSLHPRGLHDFLDLLVALGMLERDSGVYSNGPEAGMFLDRAKPTYVGGILEMGNARLYTFWGSLEEALRTGQPQNETSKGGPNLFAELYSDPARLRQFLGAMTGLSVMGARMIAAKFPFENYKTFVDVGCAQGGAPVQVALAHPHLQGIGFDLAPVGPIFEEYAASFGLSQRLRFQTGDFFKDPLPRADVIVMGHILHDWDLETKRMLIRKAYDALPPGGAFIAHENLIDDDRRKNVMGLMSSLTMLIETPGGFGFTGADCQGWMKEAGFRETRVEPLAGHDGMVIGIK
jgi:precorrin-6B methylase 2